MKNRIYAYPISLLLMLSFSVYAQKTLTITEHKHGFFENFFGNGDDEFVCYNKVHRNFYSGIFASIIGLILSFSLIENRYFCIAYP